MSTRPGLLLASLASLIALGALSFTGAVEAKSELPADGRIVFSSTLPSWPPPGNLNAARSYRVSAAGSKPLQLDKVEPTDDGDLLTSLSPDGRKLAVVRGDEYGAMTIWLVNTDGSGERELFAATSQATGLLDLQSAVPVSWAPESTRIAINLYDASGCGPTDHNCATAFVAIVDLDGRRLGTIHAAENAAWAPDGRRLAIESNDFFGRSPEETTIEVVDLESGTPRNISGGLAGDGDACLEHPTWSADGRLVAFDDTDCSGYDATINGFFVVRASDGSVVASKTGRFAGWSPRYEGYAYFGARTSEPLYVVVGAQRVKRLARSTTGCVLWSRDGSHLYYSGTGTGHPLFSIRRTGGNPLRVVQRTAGECAVGSRDGTSLALRAPTRSQLSIVPAGGGRLKKVAAVPREGWTMLLGWSGDGRGVIYSNVTPSLDRMALWTIDLEGKSASRLEDGGVDASEPSWSPDGTAVAFDRAPTKKDPGGIAIAYTDGKPQSPLVVSRSRFLSGPAWSPDGAWIAYECDGAICLIRPNGKNERAVASPLLQGAPLTAPAWSPDSRWIAYVFAGTVRAVRPDGSGDHQLVAPPGGAVSFLTAPAYSPDGSRLAIEGERCADPDTEICPRSIYVADGAGNGIHPVSGSEGGGEPAWLPDGRTIAFVGPATLGRTRFDHQLFRIDAEGGTPVPIASFRSDAVDPDSSRAG